MNTGLCALSLGVALSCVAGANAATTLTADPTGLPSDTDLTTFFDGVTLETADPTSFGGVGSFIPGTIVASGDGGSFGGRFSVSFGSSSDAGFGNSGAFVATFDELATSVRLDHSFVSGGDFVMQAFDADGVLVATDSVAEFTSPGTFEVSVTGFSIERVAVFATSDLDDPPLTVSLGPLEWTVPAPGALGVFAAAAVAASRRRRA
ncbi:MAG: hypothetical protein AAGI30_02285 [Planctomycetota bacterium]